MTIKETGPFESHKVTVLDSLFPNGASSLLLIQCAILFMHMSSGLCWWAAAMPALFFPFLQKMRRREKIIPAELLCFYSPSVLC